MILGKKPLSRRRMWLWGELVISLYRYMLMLLARKIYQEPATHPDRKVGVRRSRTRSYRVVQGALCEVLEAIYEPTTGLAG